MQASKPDCRRYADFHTVLKLLVLFPGRYFFPKSLQRPAECVCQNLERLSGSPVERLGLPGTVQGVLPCYKVTLLVLGAVYESNVALEPAACERSEATCGAQRCKQIICACNDNSARICTDGKFVAGYTHC